MTAKEYLKQIRKLDKMIENKVFERERLISLAYGTTAKPGGDRVQTSTGTQKMADAVSAAVDIDKEIKEDTQEIVRLKSEVIQTIEQLDAEEYDVLHKVYVQYYTLYEAARKLGRSKSWAYKVHKKAIRNVQEILNRREKGCAK